MSSTRRIVLVSFAFAAGLAQAPGPRIQNVENGLRFGISLAGQPPPRFALDTRMRLLHVPGVSVAVLDAGKVDWARGYGLAAADRTQPVTSRTLFQAASISKPVAAMTAMRLVEMGRLSLDEDVNLKLRSWRVPESGSLAAQKVTLRRLMSHTAGLTVHGFPGYAAAARVPTLAQLLAGSAPANTKPVIADLVPGTRWRYSGGGYQVMQMLIEDVTGEPFHEVARKLVLAPLGMKDSTYEQPLPERRAASAASGHRNDGKPIDGRWHTYPEQAAAGLWTTPTDLAQVVFEMQGGGKVLRKETVETMLIPLLGNYGLGFSIASTGGQKSFSHGGANEGFRCHLIGYRTGGRGAIVMTNGDQGGQVAAEVLRSIAAEYNWPDFLPTERKVVPVPGEILQSYAGRYAFQPQPTVIVTVEGGRLFADSPMTGKVELFSASSESFFDLEGRMPPLTFKRTPEGTVTLSGRGQTAARQAP